MPFVLVNGLLRQNLLFKEARTQILSTRDYFATALRPWVPSHVLQCLNFPWTKFQCPGF